MLLLNKKNKYQNKNKCTQYHYISIPFKSQAYSKQGSPTFLLFGLWSFGKEKNFPENSNLPNLVDIQR